MMTCELAAAVAVWRRQSVEPAARELLGAGVSGLDHYGVYACRPAGQQCERGTQPFSMTFDRIRHIRFHRGIKRTRLFADAFLNQGEL